MPTAPPTLIGGGVFTGNVRAVSDGKSVKNTDENGYIYLRGGLYNIRPDDSYLMSVPTDEGENILIVKIVETRVDNQTFYQVEEIGNAHILYYSYFYTSADGQSHSASVLDPYAVENTKVTVSIEEADGAEQVTGRWVLVDENDEEREISEDDFEIVDGDVTDASFSFIMPDHDVKLRGDFREGTNEYEGKTVILHSNDVHGAIMGYSYIAALRDEFKSKGADTLLVDAGDFSQGDPNVSLSKGADAVTMMNAAGYDLATLGNHEFDFGYEQLMSNLDDAEFKIICADVFENGETILDPNWMYENDETGLKIGFFGMETPETQTKVNPGLIQGIQFVSNTGTDKKALYTCAQNEIESLTENGADVIIALTHLGVDEESATDADTGAWIYIIIRRELI